MGLEINQEIIKYLFMTMGTRDDSDLVVENQTFEQEDFKYLGYMLLTRVTMLWKNCLSQNSFLDNQRNAGTQVSYGQC